MRLIEEKYGQYKQVLRIMDDFTAEIEVWQNGYLLFNGRAKNIVDNGQILKFKDINGKQYEFVKYTITTST